MPSQITSWSFSRLSTYAKCPQMAKFKFIDKLKEPGSPAMERGTALHKSAEDYVKKVSDGLTAEVALHFLPHLKFLREEPTAVAEETWTFRQDWTTTQWNDWNGAWLRVKVDVSYFEDPHTLCPIDYKSGKYSEFKNAEYEQQVELYGVAAMHFLPEVEVVKPALWYFDAGLVYPDPATPIIYTREELPRLTQKWESAVRPMLTDTQFKPRPSNECRWCHFRRENGGPCKF